MLPVWPQYFDAAHALLYVVNVNAAGLLAAAITELHTLLSHQGLQVMLLTNDTRHKHGSGF